MSRDSAEKCRDHKHRECQEGFFGSVVSSFDFSFQAEIWMQSCITRTTISSYVQSAFFSIDSPLIFIFDSIFHSKTQIKCAQIQRTQMKQRQNNETFKTIKTTESRRTKKKWEMAIKWNGLRCHFARIQIANKLRGNNLLSKYRSDKVLQNKTEVENNK